MRDQGIVLRAHCDMNDPRQHAAWALMACKRVQLDTEDPNEMVEDSSPVPVPQMMVPHISSALHRRGFRWHEDLMQEDFVPNPGSRGNWMMPNGIWLPIDEARQVRAERAAAAAEAGTDVHDTIRRLMPDLAKKLDEMTPEERQVETQRRADLLRHQLDQMAQLQAALDTAATQPNQETS